MSDNKIIEHITCPAGYISSYMPNGTGYGANAATPGYYCAQAPPPPPPKTTCAQNTVYTSNKSNSNLDCVCPSAYPKMQNATDTAGSNKYMCTTNTCTTKAAGKACPTGTVQVKTYNTYYMSSDLCCPK
jgi:hypothetical protein